MFCNGGLSTAENPKIFWLHELDSCRFQSGDLILYAIKTIFFVELYAYIKMHKENTKYTYILQGNASFDFNHRPHDSDNKIGNLI